LGYLEWVSRESKGFLNPRDGLEQQYRRAVEDLRREVGDPKTLADQWRFWRARRRLWREKVVLPIRSGNW
jgi:hypothetical protein